MKRLNFNVKDRKVLTLGLCLVLVCVFTLTIAYAALNAVLTISGNAQVTASNWDIHLANPKVTNGSVNTTIPTISGNILNFNTTLTTPGDFYEFTVDVVNNGSIDAIINNVVKNPELTTEQAKYLKYEITYLNGESISNKQLLAKNKTMPIKVRIEYRTDLVAEDLPSTNTTLNMSLTLEYIQSDGSGNNVINNGYPPAEIIIDGDINNVGTLVTIDTESFYTIGTEGNNVKLLSKYNLYVGGVSDGKNWTPYGEEATGIQDAAMITANNIFNGTVAFSNVSSSYSGSIVEGYVNNYKKYLLNLGVNIEDARLLTNDEIMALGIQQSGTSACENAPEFLGNNPFWTSITNGNGVYFVACPSFYVPVPYSTNIIAGVRPVIIISKDYFN